MDSTFLNVPHDVAADLRHVRLRVLPLRDGGADCTQHPVANLLARVQHLVQLLDVLSLLAMTRLTRSHGLTVEMGVGGCAANSCIELRDLVVLLSQLLLKGSHSTLQVTHIPGRGVSVLRVAPGAQSHSSLNPLHRGYISVHQLFIHI